MTPAEWIILAIALVVVAGVLLGAYQLGQPVDRCQECGAHFVMWEQTRSIAGRSYTFRMKGCPKVRDGIADGDLMVGHHAEVIDTRYAK